MTKWWEYHDQYCECPKCGHTWSGDGAIQRIEKGNKSPKTMLSQLRIALGAARRLQHIFPQRDWSLLRCQNEDELPWFKTEGIPRSYARTNWNKYKQEKQQAQSTPSLYEFLKREKKA